MRLFIFSSKPDLYHCYYFSKLLLNLLMWLAYYKMGRYLTYSPIKSNIYPLCKSPFNRLSYKVLLLVTIFIFSRSPKSGMTIWDFLLFLYNFLDLLWCTKLFPVISPNSLHIPYFWLIRQIYFTPKFDVKIRLWPTHWR